MSSPHVIVIGAGLGGLALAQGLRQAGIEVTVYERDTSLTARRQGYRLHLDAHARDALLRLLPPRLFELFLATAGTPNPQFVLLDDQLNHILTQDTPEEPAHFAVDRLVLRQILLAGLEDIVRFGTRFQRYEIGSQGRVTAYFADGSHAGGDVLVAADGVNSAVRGQYLPHARIMDTGVRQLYGMIPLSDRTRPLFDDRMLGIFTAITGQDGTFVGVAPVQFPERPQQAAARIAPELRLPPVSDYMTCSFGARREWFGDADTRLRSMSGQELHAIITDAVRTWHPRVRKIIAACDPASVFALPLRTSIPVAGWATTQVTLLGDAIHAMSPAAGAGACAALRDADRLTTALRTAAAGHDLLNALRAYESEMIDYGFAAVRAGASNGQRFLGQDPLPDEQPAASA
ncbi:FAD-dependent oxidoreductase [Amycolatopsis taiwanensis]|uniref:FAD-dependent oxidoreductase n=1 Tax=Amycolatopsis taiwanensis TaxID=342230 RepID=UPI00048317F2|nr:FAD-dependent monooxygenase [Amycolatopsis taiwanensis]